MKRLDVLVCGCVAVLSATALAEEPVLSAKEVAREAAAAQRKAWLWQQVERRVTDQQQLSDWQQRLESMSAAEVNRTAAAFLSQLAREDRPQDQALLERARHDRQWHEAASSDESLFMGGPKSPGFHAFVGVLPWGGWGWPLGGHRTAVWMAGHRNAFVSVSSFAILPSWGFCGVSYAPFCSFGWGIPAFSIVHRHIVHHGHFGGHRAPFGHHHGGGFGPHGRGRHRPQR